VVGLGKPSFMKALIFDTETTNFVNFKTPPEHDSQPDIVQIAALLCEGVPNGSFIKRASLDFVVIPNKAVSAGAAATHGIGDQTIRDYGVSPQVALSAFQGLLEQADVLVAHNMTFDASVLRTAWHRTFGVDLRSLLGEKRAFCTMKAATPVCKILKANARHREDYKWPTLSQAHEFFFGIGVDGAHDALIDAAACARIYFELMARRKKENENVEVSS
jgi:DNA polymerase-3 subunit epsilon